MREFRVEVEGQGTVVELTKNTSPTSSCQSALATTPVVSFRYVRDVDDGASSTVGSSKPYSCTRKASAAFASPINEAAAASDDLGGSWPSAPRAAAMSSRTS